MKRSLYQCSEARICGDRIYCHAGKRLNSRSENGDINIRLLKRGNPLELAICQDCNDYDCNGKPIPASERGWK